MSGILDYDSDQSVVVIRKTAEAWPCRPAKRGDMWQVVSSSGLSFK